jgi:hypothetical protein
MYESRKVKRKFRPTAFGRMEEEEEEEAESYEKLRIEELVLFIKYY